MGLRLRPGSSPRDALGDISSRPSGTVNQRRVLTSERILTAGHDGPQPRPSSSPFPTTPVLDKSVSLTIGEMGMSGLNHLPSTLTLTG
jgi:hypothetical protein